jgi:hypothetical protein
MKIAEPTVKRATVRICFVRTFSRMRQRYIRAAERVKPLATTCEESAALTTFHIPMSFLTERKGAAVSGTLGIAAAF